jgi:predicted nuclease of predicted toxin-antitoxin system
VKLLLDEHYSPEIARQLGTRGHDVVAVAERADLVGLGDDELLRRMTREQRAIMTNNVKDFLPLVGRAAVASDDHAGLLLTSDRSMPRHSDAIGRFVEALDAFLRRHQGDDACRNQVQWLGGSAAVGGATPPASIRRAGAGE